MRKLIRILLGVLVIVFVFSIGPVRAEEGEQ